MNLRMLSKTSDNKMLLTWGWLISVLILIVISVFGSASVTSVLIEILILGLAAMALNLLLGYTGLVAFGQSAFYGVGAYSLALILSYTSMPFWLAMIIAPVISALVALIIGLFCIRLIEIYFGLFTMAFGVLIYTVIHKWYDFTGGDRGLYIEQMPQNLIPIENYFFFTLVIVVICFIIMRLIVDSPFGHSLRAIRENRLRAEFIGINVRKYTLIIFVMAGFFTGVAGALYAGFSRTAFPDFAGINKSGELLFICLLGGMYNFTGPILGTIIYVLLQVTLIPRTTYWPMIFGTIIILLVLFLRGGVAGFISQQVRLLLGKVGSLTR